MCWQSDAAFRPIRSRQSSGTSSPRPAASATFRSTPSCRSNRRRFAPPARRRLSPGSMRSRRRASRALDATACGGQTTAAMLRSALLNVMIKAAHKAGRMLKRDFGEIEHLQVSVKGPANFVTVADRRAEEIVCEELERARPGYGFLGEEGGAREGSDKTHRWIVDPLDGTLNFLHGIPHFAISIALEREGTIVAGIIYNPVGDELFTAERGEVVLNRNEHNAVQDRIAGLRRLGAASLDLAWVAAGRFDAYWERGLSPWDMAAGIALVREAGGFVTDLKGREDMIKTGGILAANEDIHRQMLRALKDAPHSLSVARRSSA